MTYLFKSAETDVTQDNYYVSISDKPVSDKPGYEVNINQATKVKLTSPVEINVGAERPILAQLLTAIYNCHGRPQHLLFMYGWRVRTRFGQPCTDASSLNVASYR